MTKSLLEQPGGKQESLHSAPSKWVVGIQKLQPWRESLPF